MPASADRLSRISIAIAFIGALVFAGVRCSGKPEKVVDKIVEGKMERFYSEVCLLEQAFIKDPDRRVGDIIKDAIAKLKENIQVRRFARYHLGEGVEKQ